MNRRGDRLLYKNFQIKKSQIRTRYFIIFTVLLIAEIFIALFLHDKIIRPYVGDILVVILIYTFLRIFIPSGLKYLVWYVFLFAAFVELLQYFNIGRLLGLYDNRVAMIIIGSTFDVKDLLCYLAGCLIVWFVERHKKFIDIIQRW